jgi:hypothetical protein
LKKQFLLLLPEDNQQLKNFPKVHWSRNLLVLNIGMEEIKFVEHKINLHPASALPPVVVTE